jgi:hypothetical protein
MAQSNQADGGAAAQIDPDPEYEHVEGELEGVCSWYKTPDGFEIGVYHCEDAGAGLNAGKQLVRLFGPRDSGSGHGPLGDLLANGHAPPESVGEQVETLFATRHIHQPQEAER